MQALLYNLAAEQPCEQPHTAEEDAQAKVEELKDNGKDLRVFRETTMPAAPALDRMAPDHKHWPKRQQVDPYAAPHPQALLQFDAQNRHDLREPKLPGSFAEKLARRG